MYNANANGNICLLLIRKYSVFGIRWKRVVSFTVCWNLWDVCLKTILKKKVLPNSVALSDLSETDKDFIPNLFFDVVLNVSIITMSLVSLRATCDVNFFSFFCCRLCSFCYLIHLLEILMHQFPIYEVVCSAPWSTSQKQLLNIDLRKRSFLAGLSPCMLDILKFRSEKLISTLRFHISPFVAICDVGWNGF